MFMRNKRAEKERGNSFHQSSLRLFVSMRNIRTGREREVPSILFYIHVQQHQLKIMNESAINLSPIFYSFSVVMRHCHAHLSCSLVVLSFCLSLSLTQTHTHTHTHTHTLFTVHIYKIKII
jgi:hypothetical protein